MNVSAQIEDLKSRSYDDIPLEICGGIYKTMAQKGYQTYWTDSEDENVRAWIALSGAREVAPFGKVDLIFIANELDDGQLDLQCRRIKRKGQIAFYNVSPIRLRRYFDAGFEKWSTFEPPIDLFIALRL